MCASVPAPSFRDSANSHKLGVPKEEELSCAPASKASVPEGETAKQQQQEEEDLYTCLLTKRMPGYGWLATCS
ncbi:hypothetical protein TKK_0001560 [Trichogramma kaykai]